jgi:hypothetical protein
MNPRTGLDDEGKRELPYRDSNSDPSVIHPVSSLYADSCYFSKIRFSIILTVTRVQSDHLEHQCIVGNGAEESTMLPVLFQAK